MRMPILCSFLKTGIDAGQYYRPNHVLGFKQSVELTMNHVQFMLALLQPCTWLHTVCRVDNHVQFMLALLQPSAWLHTVGRVDNHVRLMLALLQPCTWPQTVCSVDNHVRLMLALRQPCTWPQISVGLTTMRV